MQNTECIVLQFPTGKRLSADHSMEEKLPIVDPKPHNDQGRPWTVEDFIEAAKRSKELEGWKLALFRNLTLCKCVDYWTNEALFVDGTGVFMELSFFRNKLAVYMMRHRCARYFYGIADQRLFSWRETFPHGKPWPWEKKYLDEPGSGLCSQGGLSISIIQHSPRFTGGFSIVSRFFTERTIIFVRPNM